MQLSQIGPTLLIHNQINSLKHEFHLSDILKIQFLPHRNTVLLNWHELSLIVVREAGLSTLRIIVNSLIQPVSRINNSEMMKHVMHTATKIVYVSKICHETKLRKRNPDAFLPHISEVNIMRIVHFKDIYVLMMPGSG
jgi:hypothetical protein